LTNGDCGPVKLEVRREGVAVAVAATRLDSSAAGSSAHTHGLPGPTFRLLSKNVAYLKLSSVKAADAPQYIEQAKGTRGLRHSELPFGIRRVCTWAATRPTADAVCEVQHRRSV
jgi:hypothetical protein